MTAPRGIRNNNPGNIVRDGTAWQGMSADQSGDPRFCVFERPEYGLRAIARILTTYQERYGLDTVAELVRRWAPPNENDTGAYVEAVSNEVGVDAGAHLDLAHLPTMRALVAAIVRHENGQQPYPNDVLDAGLKLAGIIGETTT